MPLRSPTLVLAACLGGCILCLGCDSESVTVSHNSSFSITIDQNGEGQSVQYETKTGSYPMLTVSEVRFELRDPAAYSIDFKALGIEGVSVVKSVNYQSTGEVETGLMSVLGRPVEIEDDVLIWGGDVVGTVEPGDTVVVDSRGLTISN